MFNSVCTILGHYLDNVSRYTIYSIDMERGENTEDLYYICHINGVWYVVYETDYISSLTSALHEALIIFAPRGIQPLHWLVKKDNYDVVKTTSLPLQITDNDKPLRHALVLKRVESYLLHAVIEVEVDEPDEWQG